MSDSFKLPQRSKVLFEGIHEFEMKWQIGKGGFSKVFLGIHINSGEKYAIKIISFSQLSPFDVQNIYREILVHRKLDHPNIVKLVDYFIDEENLYFVQEYLEGGNLYQYMYRQNFLGVQKIQKIFRQILDAVSYLHSVKFIQRDIKPENIISDLNKNVFKICDFGWASHFEDSSWLKLKGGTFAYMAPETIKGRLQTGKIDTWALGVLLFELFFLKEPFKGKRVKERLKSIYKKNYLSKLDKLPDSAKDLIIQCLRINPENRIEIKDIPHHQFLSEDFEIKRQKAKKKRKPKKNLNLSIPKYTQFSDQGQKLLDLTYLKSLSSRKNIKKKKIIKLSREKIELNSSAIKRLHKNASIDRLYNRSRSRFKFNLKFDTYLNQINLQILNSRKQLERTPINDNMQ